MDSASVFGIEAVQIYDITDKVEQFSREIAQKENNGLNLNVFVYSDGQSSKIDQSRKDAKERQLPDRRNNELHAKDNTKYLEKINLKMIPNRIDNINKNNFDDRCTLPDSRYSLSIVQYPRPSKLESTHTKYKIDHFIDFIQEFNQTIITTINSKTGEFKSRPMYIYDRIQDLYFYLLSKYGSNLVTEIKTDPRVNLTFEQEDKKPTKWCSINANADFATYHYIIDGLWNPSVRTWLKDQGNNLKNGSKKDPRLILIFIEAKSIDYFTGNHQFAFIELNNAIDNLKSAKYCSDITCHLFMYEIDDYIENHCQLE